MSRLAPLLALAVLALALGTIEYAPPERIHAALRELATHNPEARVPIIVQKLASDNAVEARVAELGGTVTKDLSIINAFAAELPAAQVVTLATEPGVRWISLDAPVQSADSTNHQRKFTAWATRLGTATSNTFTEPEKMVSPVGRNGTFGHGSQAQGAFTGFAVEVTPGQEIRKVKATLVAYVPAKLRPASNASLVVFVNGRREGSFVLSHTDFNGHVGADKAGTIELDITGNRTWSWADFNTLELVIDQSSFARDQVVFYDAIGVHVSTAPGNKSSRSQKSSALFGAPADRATGSDGSTATLAETVGAPIDTRNLRNVYNRVVRATDVWNEGPAYIQGQGVTVAVVDSGVFNTSNLQGRVLGNFNFNPAYHDGLDRYGHGTHVAGIIADDGTINGGQYMGIAPKANILNIRVSDDQGGATESDVVSGLQWINDNRTAYNIRVVNLSLNSSVAQSYKTSPMDAAAEILWFNGIVVVAAAGNNGTATLYPPANDPFVITVGATADKGTPSLLDDTVARFSAWGTTEDGFVKPDLVAPGSKIVAYLPDNPLLESPKKHPANQVDANYFRMSGTSMAAPVVSGAVALLLQSNPSLTPDQVKSRLKATAISDPLLWPGYDPVKAGAGYLDVHAAVHSTTTELANTGVVPHPLLAQMALIAAWASQSGGSIIDWNSVDWSSINWNSIDWNSVNWNSVNWNSVNWNSVNWNSVNWNSVNWNSVNWNSVNWNSVNWNSVNWNSVNWNSVNWSSDYWGEDE